MNTKMIRYILGWLLIFEAIFFTIPVITAAIYKEQAVWSFAICAVICFVAGKLLSLKKPKDTTLYSKEGFVIAALSWIVMSIFGAFPFIMTKVTSSYIDALFETVSGFTTTGSTIFNDVEALPKSINMWRCFTHWIGGMGVLVFLMAFLPLSGGENMHIMKAESPGPSVSKLVPRVKTTALILYSIYFLLTVLQFIILVVEGMPVFDSICTAIGTAGTGGFGIKNDSLSGYSGTIQITVTVFMILFSINFNSYFLLLNGKIKDAFNYEVRTFLVIVAVASGLIVLDMYSAFDTVGEAIKHATFSVASLISTSGYMSVDFDKWKSLSKTVLVLVMFIGACAGSTGGGIKVSRIVILFKGVKNELSTIIHPRQIKKVSVDKHSVEDYTVRGVLVYLACYVLIFTVSLLLISWEGYDLTTNFTSITTTLNNIGPGLELVGPTQNFAFWSVPSKLIFIFNMLAGRLELFPMLILFYPKTWKK